MASANHLRPALAVAAATILLACGSPSAEDGDGVASLDQATTGDEASSSPAASASPEPDFEEALLAHAQCMRDNGVEDFQDPEVEGEGGAVRMQVGPNAPEELKEAQATCEHLLPRRGPATDGDGEGRPALDEEAALAFSECMREEGVEDFPDPGADGMPDPEAIMELDVESEQFQAAMETCGDQAGFGFAFNNEGSSNSSQEDGS